MPVEIVCRAFTHHPPIVAGRGAFCLRDGRLLLAYPSPAQPSPRLRLAIRRNGRVGVGWVGGACSFAARGKVPTESF